MVASTESQSWIRLDNGVENKFSPSTFPASPPDLPASIVNGISCYFNSSSDLVLRSMKNVEEPAVFAVPAVPRKPSRKTTVSLPTVANVRSKNRKNAPKRPPRNCHGISFVEASRPPTGSLSETKDKKTGMELGEQPMAQMIISLTGMQKNRDEGKLAEFSQRFSRLNKYLSGGSVENTLKTGLSTFHDFLNRESYKPDTRTSLSVDEDIPQGISGSPKNKKSTKEDISGNSLFASSKVKDVQTMHDLFGVLTVSKDDMKNRTPSQLVEFVKRVESNQRREAFEKQQRPAYLLKLARSQSMDRAKILTDVSDGLHRLVDQINDEDPFITDSSSGGNSADEAEEETFQKRFESDRLIPIDRRALYRYATARHSVAARYSFAHRQLARSEYGYQVTANLLQRLQQKQGVPLFGGGTGEDAKPSLKVPSFLHKDSLSPRAWDDREVAALAKTANAMAFLRIPTPKTDAGHSLHPSAGSIPRRRMKVALPNTGLNFAFETYEATMWKDRLSMGRIIQEGSESEDVDEPDEDAAKDVRELTEAVVSSARGCARARPLASFRKRMMVQLDAFPPKRYQLEEKVRRCDCQTRSILPEVFGPISCALCMGLISLPSWSSRTNLLRIPGKESLGLIDHGFHSRLSQPSHRALDVELSGVSMDIDPAEVSTMKGPVKSRPSARRKALAFVKSQGEAVALLRKQEEELRLERERLRSLQYNAHESSKRHKGKNSGSAANRSKNQKNRGSLARNRKRRHSSVSSDTTISSGVSSLTRSTSIGSGDNLKTSSSKRGAAVRTTEKPGIPGNRRRPEVHADLTSFVIPYGMTAPSKIEKIQYKEIVVPKFRDLKSVCTINGIREFSAGPTVTPVELDALSDATENPSEEDLDDQVFGERHTKCENEERSRFSLPEKNPRRRAAPGEGKFAGRNVKRRRLGGFLGVDRRKSLATGKTLRRNLTHFGKNDPRKRGSPKKHPDDNLGDGEEKKMTYRRPRKTAEEIAALYAQRAARPVRARRSTFRASPDENGDG